jgi:hypothetical protein
VATLLYFTLPDSSLYDISRSVSVKNLTKAFMPTVAIIYFSGAGLTKNSF